MASVNRVVENEQDRKMLLKFIEGRKLPLTVTVTDGRQRTTSQNRLQRTWVNEIAAQLGDRTPEEVRGYLKLHFGVPMLRNENDAFKARYDEVVKPLSYEQKLMIMQEPLDMPITRLFTTRQKTAYLEAIYKHFTEQGIVLTLPDDHGLSQIKGRDAA